VDPGVNGTHKSVTVEHRSGADHGVLADGASSGEAMAIIVIYTMRRVD
jgi:uncharacterized protein YoaH (UPF0181 family)